MSLGLGKLVFRTQLVRFFLSVLEFVVDCYGLGSCFVAHYTFRACLIYRIGKVEG